MAIYSNYWKPAMGGIHLLAEDYTVTTVVDDASIVLMCTMRKRITVLIMNFNYYTCKSMR